MESRVSVLRAVSDALFPALECRAAESEAAGDPVSAALYRHGGASEEVIYKVIQTIEARLPADARRELYLLLRLLSSRLGSLLLLGRAAFSSGFGLPTAFPDLPQEQREAVLMSWASSPDARMRKAFKGLKSLLMSALFTHLTHDDNSALLVAMRYPIGDPQRPPAPAPPAAAAEAAVADGLVDLSGHDSSPGSAAGAGAALAAKGLRVVWPGDFGSAAVDRERPQLAVQCDVVVVGSGAGGGVAAANLAAAGLRIVVLEKSSFVPARDMTLQEGQAFQAMYEQGGILSSEDASINLLAGSTLGGGTRVNWCASFHTPDHVRREWAEQQGLPNFASSKYKEAMQAVCSRLGVRTGFKHSNMCSTLQSGLRALGVHCGEVPRNCLNPDCCGHCCLGCARGHKQDAVNTWLADACQTGARIITGAWAERLLLEPHSGKPAAAGEDSHTRRRQVAGVLALAGSAAAPLRLAIQAPVVVSAAGSLHSPALLLRSGVSCRGNVGANLRLHPCTCVVGLFPQRDSIQQQQRAGRQQEGDGLGDMEDLASPSDLYEHPRHADGCRAGGNDGSGSGAASTATAASARAAAAEEPHRQQHSCATSSGELHAYRAGSGGPAGSHLRNLLSGQPGSQPESQVSTQQGGHLCTQPTGSIRCWEGTLMSVFSKQVGDWEGSGYGSLLYTPAVHPGLFAAASPWLGGADFKELMLQYHSCCVVLVLVRDQNPGRITVDKSGRPRIHYTLSKRDEASMLKGVELGLRCLAAAGATTLLTTRNAPAGRFTFTDPEAKERPGSGRSHSSSPPTTAAPAAAPLEGGKTALAAREQQQHSPTAGIGGAASSLVLPGSASGGSEAFEEYVSDVARTGIIPLQTSLFSAHQMGTCRLGSDPQTSVLDPEGQCWDVAGLYCLDGSTFPTPTGVNPMVSIESISYMLSKQLAVRLVESGLGSTGASKRRDRTGAQQPSTQCSSKL